MKPAVRSSGVLGISALIVVILAIPSLGFWLYQAWHWDGVCKACLMPWKYGHRDGHTSFEGNLDRMAHPLKGIAQAQMDFRTHDRAATGSHGFWRADIAGLYAFIPTTTPKEFPPDSPLNRNSYAMKLIELSVAAADDEPMTDVTPFCVPGPKAGYRFRALRHEDEITPSPDRFAACMFPEDRSYGRWTMIIDETNVIYYKDLESQRGPEFFPRDPRVAGWRKLKP